MLAFPHHPIKIKISQTVSSILNFDNRDIEGINLNVIQLLNFCSGAWWPCHFDLFLHKIERKRKIVINMSLLGTVHILVSCRPCDGEMNSYRQFWRMYHLLKLSLFHIKESTYGMKWLKWLPFPLPVYSILPAQARMNVQNERKWGKWHLKSLLNDPMGQNRIGTISSHRNGLRQIRVAQEGKIREPGRTHPHMVAGFWLARLEHWVLHLLADCCCPPWSLLVNFSPALLT